MGSLLRPVGPLPAWVYWARRAVLFVLLALLIWLVASSLTPNDPKGAAAPARGDGAGPTSNASDRPQSRNTPSAPSAPRPTSGGGKESHMPEVKVPATSPAHTKQPGARPVASPSACPASWLEVRTDAAKDGPAMAGSEVDVVVEIVNDGADPCVLTVDAESFQVQVTSGNDLIWDTSHCPSVVPSGTFTLGPAKAQRVAIAWPGMRSREGCPSGQPKALPGYYAAGASVHGRASATDRFQLTAI
ncbi:hypothetical protein ABN028_13630 [Actinopolymorpha sp. B17G11]|uniref:hypothetical protein n=1 Tax=unclassified Actinopolymorpha TaxID=2627063 RepID=UPI0032D8CDF1